MKNPLMIELKLKVWHVLLIMAVSDFLYAQLVKPLLHAAWPNLW